MADPVERSQFSFFFPIRVRYSEVDGQSVVYNAHYLTYFDVGLHEFFRAGGCDYVRLMADAGVDSRVVHASVDYLAPVAFDDRIEIAARVARIGRSSITYELAIFAASLPEAKARGTIVWVVADNESGKSTEIPPAVRSALEHLHPLP